MNVWNFTGNIGKDAEVGSTQGEFTLERLYNGFSLTPEQLDRVSIEVKSI